MFDIDSHLWLHQGFFLTWGISCEEPAICCAIASSYILAWCSFRSEAGRSWHSINQHFHKTSRSMSLYIHLFNIVNYLLTWSAMHAFRNLETRGRNVFHSDCVIYDNDTAGCRTSAYLEIWFFCSLMNEKVLWNRIQHDPELLVDLNLGNFFI